MLLLLTLDLLNVYVSTVKILMGKVVQSRIQWVQNHMMQLLVSWCAC